MNEQRISAASFEVRDIGEAKTIAGYAALYGVRSRNLGSERLPLYEVILQGALRNRLNDDVRALVNHNGGLTTLARTKSGTLKLTEDETGLRYEFEVPDTQAGRDIYEIIKRGDIDQSSFAFRIKRSGETYKRVLENDREVVIREISEVSELFDVSIVTYPAYDETMVEARGFEEFQKTLLKQEAERHARARRIRIAELS